MSSKWRVGVVVVVAGLLQQLLYGGVYISEFLADNSGGIRDEDGKREDWIELHNSGEEAVSLAGWWLSDKVKNKTMWEFPAVTIEPDGYLLVWASGKDRRDPGSELHTSFSLSKGGSIWGFMRLIQ